MVNFGFKVALWIGCYLTITCAQNVTVLNNSQCWSVPNREIVRRPPPPTPAPTLPPSSQCKGNMAVCLSSAECCNVTSSAVCRVGYNTTTMYCQPKCTKNMTQACSASDVCCNGAVCRGNSTTNVTTCQKQCVNANSMCVPGQDVCCDKDFQCLNITNFANEYRCYNTYCKCGDKDSGTVEGSGKVTGGGWIYLTNKTFLNPAFLCGNNWNNCPPAAYENIYGGGTLNGIKANYGFVAMWRKGVPYGSTNFDVDGGYFHFHSDTQNTPLRGLEVIDGVHARWWGKGSVSSSLSPKKKKDWDNNYCFFVAVQDNGEPGWLDQWRIRIWKCSLCAQGSTDPLTWDNAAWDSCGDDQTVLLFDSNYVPYYGSTSVQPFVNNPPSASDPPLVNGNTIVSGGWTFSNYSKIFPLMSANAGNDPNIFRCNGTQVGDLVKHGGGNIQIHLSNKRNKYIDYIQSLNASCDCNDTTTEVYDKGFVTGGGFIFMDVDSFLKVKNCASLVNLANGNSASAISSNYDAVLDACGTPGMVGAKATYGFNAKTINGNIQGSWNFDLHGFGFHFKSEKIASQSNADFDYLEVVCDDRYGRACNGVCARFSGVGRISWTSPNVLPNNTTSWSDAVYRFYVSVQDNGEPGLNDKIRFRVDDYYMPNTVYFDSDLNAGPVYFMDVLCTYLGWNCADTSTTYPDFTGDWFQGTDVGFTNWTKAGGGNIQLHCKGGPS